MEKSFKEKCGENYASLKNKINSRFISALLDGLVKAFKTAFRLLKLTIPIYVVTVLLKYSPVMPFLVKICTPAMALFNLPAEAALPIVTGFFTDPYGVIAASHSFDFDMAAMTTIMMIASVAHSLPVEGGIALKLGINIGAVTVYRIVLGIIIGIIMGFFWGWIG